MNEIAEELEREPRLGQRVLGRIGGPDLNNPLGSHFHGLLCPLGGLLELPLDEHAGARGCQLSQREDAAVDDDLEVRATGTIVELEKREGPLPLLSPRLHPPAHD